MVLMTVCIFKNSSVSSNLEEKRQGWFTLKYNSTECYLWSNVSEPSKTTKRQLFFQC